MNNLISVIVPVYNVAGYLDECVKSIVKQTYENIEVLLIDDGSDDGSENICDDLAMKDGRIKTFHLNRGGVSQARNKGLSECSGDYIAFVDSDDFIEPEFFSMMLSHFDDDIDVVCCSYKRLFEGKVEFGNLDAETNMLLRGNDAFLEFMKQKWYTTSVWNKMFRRSAIFNPQIYFMVGRLVGEDELWLHEAVADRNLNVYFFSKPLYNWRMRKGSALHIQESHGLSDTKKDELNTKYEVMGFYDQRCDSEAYMIAAKRIYECIFSINLDAMKRKDKRAVVPIDKYYVIGRRCWFHTHKGLRERLARIKNEFAIKLFKNRG